MALDLTRAALQIAGSSCPIPGLSVAFSIADQMIGVALTAKDNDGRLLDISTTVADTLLRISRAMQGRWDSIPDTMHMHITEFNGQLEGISKELKKQSKASRFSAFINANKRQSNLDRWEKRLLRAEQAFMLLLCVETSVTVNELKTNALNNLTVALSDPFARPFRRYSSHLAQNLNGRLTKITHDFFAGGAWATFSKLYWEALGLVVSVKQFKFQESERRKKMEVEGPEREWLIGRFVHQYRIRQNLDHPNVVPLIGTCDDLNAVPSLVSPFYENGNIRDYLYRHLDADKLNLIIGVAKGLEYLHTRQPAVLHGDMRANAIMVDEGGKARIGGFSWSVFANAATENAPGVNEHSIQWYAPEMVKRETIPSISDGTVDSANTSASARHSLLTWDYVADPGGDRELFERTEMEFEVYSVYDGVQLTEKTDVWAFGMTVLEIYAPSQHPMHRAVATLRSHRRGTKPRREQYRHIPLPVWTVLEVCWELDPLRRPSASTIVRGLEAAKREMDGKDWSPDVDDATMRYAAKRVRDVIEAGSSLDALANVRVDLGTAHPARHQPRVVP